MPTELPKINGTPKQLFLLHTKDHNGRWYLFIASPFDQFGQCKVRWVREINRATLFTSHSRAQEYEKCRATQALNRLPELSELDPAAIEDVWLSVIEKKTKKGLVRYFSPARKTPFVMSIFDAKTYLDRAKAEKRLAALIRRDPQCDFRLVDLQARMVKKFILLEKKAA